MKSQKNGTVFGKFDLGQAEEDNSERLLAGSHGPGQRRIIMSRDLMRTCRFVARFVDPDVNGLVRGSELMKH